MGRIRYLLVRKKWITPSLSSTRLLFSILSKIGTEKARLGIAQMENMGYDVVDLNDIKSKITILFLYNVCRELHISKDKKDITKAFLDSLIKDALDD